MLLQLCLCCPLLSPSTFLSGTRATLHRQASTMERRREGQVGQGKEPVLQHSDSVFPVKCHLTVIRWKLRRPTDSLDGGLGAQWPNSAPLNPSDLQFLPLPKDLDLKKRETLLNLPPWALIISIHSSDLDKCSCFLFRCLLLWPCANLCITLLALFSI